MKERIKELADKYLEKMMKIRREIHEHPELGFQEFKTSAVVKRELDLIGIPYESEIAKTGVVGLIKGGKPGKTILLRADMDALPIHEESRVDFKSKNDGKMHACGHDGHTAGLLGAAMILNEIKDDISGNIKLMFQPAEEGPGGAEPMIKAGILENPKVDAAIGCHIWPTLEGGKVAMKSGNMMAQPTAFEIEIIGVGGHGSQPEATIDPIAIACQAVVSFQTIVSRGMSPFKEAVLSCCSIKGGETFNVIPEKVEILGTIRTYDDELTDSIINQMDSILKGLSVAYGIKYKFNPMKMYPALRNNNYMFELSKKSVEKILGEGSVIVMEEPVMGAEDFAYICKAIPANFYYIGVEDGQNEDEKSLHSPKLFWDDKRIKVNMLTLSQISLDYLEENK